MARTGRSKHEIREFLESQFGYNLHRSYDQVRAEVLQARASRDTDYEASHERIVGAEPAVQDALTAFLAGNDYEDVIRKAVTLGGDSDTIACMAGGIAEAYYGMPDHFRKEVMKRLDPEMKEIIADFETCRRLHPEKPSLPE
jgi:ADP-ribosylglycohydrolase